MRNCRLLLAALALLWTIQADAAETPTSPSPLPALPEGNTGVAAKYPGDRGIEKDPAVVFADGFETGMDKWDSPYGAPHLVHEAENVHAGQAAVEMILEWPRTERAFNNGLMQHFRPGFDVLFYRYYAKFGKDTELFDGGTHAGGAIFASTMPTDNIKAGLRADGHNQFTARLDTWRVDEEVPSPGLLCLYTYHPLQASRYGDQLFPSGQIFPNRRRRPEPPYSKDDFVERPDFIPDRGRWYCYEIMVVANTPGEHDGRLAFWIDGELTGDFPKFRVRDVEELKANIINISFYTQNRRVRDGCVMWYDDVVAATSYIGPMVDEKTPTNP
jgi:hypothetical protein